MDKPCLVVAPLAHCLLFPLCARSVISEGIVDKPADLDVATVMSMGFPAWRGGLNFWGDLQVGPFGWGRGPWDGRTHN